MTCIAVDVGNSRIKWGLGAAGAVVRSASLPADDEPAWQRQVQDWHVRPEDTWTVAGVHPARRDRFLAWLLQQNYPVRRLDSYRDLPLVVALDQPERVGIDRLLSAVAANRRRPAGVPAVIVDAGSAVTVDYVDARGAFCGGAIFPGLRLMSRALHDYTALLPLIDVQAPQPAPGTSTQEALATGIYHAVLGGSERLIDELRAQAGATPLVYLTGGDAPLLSRRMREAHHLWPEMTLEGILHSAAPD